MTRTFKTPKGTELQLLNLRGKEYLEVKHRVVWFREVCPDWAIETELISVTVDSAFARATIRDQTGRLVTTSHKYEDKKGFPDFIEKAETGAIGRALALAGFGTQFCADELDEGPRIVDGPVEPLQKKLTQIEQPKSAPSAQAKTSDPGAYRIPFGKKYKGCCLRDIPRTELENYTEWLEQDAAKKGLPLSVEAREFTLAVDRFLGGAQ